MHANGIRARGVGSDHQQYSGVLDYRKGMAVAAAGVIFLSFDAVLLRLANASSWDAAFYRGVFIFFALLAFTLATKRVDEWSKLFQRKLLGVSISALYGLNITLFVFSVQSTTVSNTVVILCFTPFFSAMFSWLLLKETLDKGTWLTMLVAGAGVAIVFWGEQDESHFIGNILALALATSTGFLLTLLRLHAEIPRIPAIAIGALLSAACLLPWSNPLSLKASTIGWLALMGLLQRPLAAVFMLSATRLIPATEIGLFLVLESLLAPMWAWLIIEEPVPKHTFIGGAIVFSVVALHCIIKIKKEHAATQQNGNLNGGLGE